MNRILKATGLTILALVGISYFCLVMGYIMGYDSIAPAYIHFIVWSGFIVTLFIGIYQNIK